MDTGIFIGDKIITTSWDKIWNKPTTLNRVTLLENKIASLQ